MSASNEFNRCGRAFLDDVERAERLSSVGWYIEGDTVGPKDRRVRSIDAQLQIRGCDRSVVYLELSGSRSIDAGIKKLERLIEQANAAIAGLREAGQWIAEGPERAAQEDSQ